MDLSHVLLVCRNTGTVLNASQCVLVSEESIPDAVWHQWMDDDCSDAETIDMASRYGLALSDCVRLRPILPGEPLS